MTVTLVVLYTRPDDPEAFDRHYLEVHAPLVDRVPGLLSWDHGRLMAAVDGGDLPYYRIATLRFANQETLDAGLGSAEGQAAAEDYQNIAPPGSRMFTADID
jgi:uncharacterized protein (TIGR02118 family)